MGVILLLFKWAILNLTNFFRVNFVDGCFSEEELLALDGWVGKI
jgi:hypothetical protein